MGQYGGNGREFPQSKTMWDNTEGHDGNEEIEIVVNQSEKILNRTCFSCY